ncbi:unnamed protein product, partial [marine sediment metagenome]
MQIHGKKIKKITTFIGLIIFIFGLIIQINSDGKIIYFSDSIQSSDTEFILTFHGRQFSNLTSSLM